MAPKVSVIFILWMNFTIYPIACSQEVKLVPNQSVVLKYRSQLLFTRIVSIETWMCIHQLWVTSAMDNDGCHQQFLFYQTKCYQKNPTLPAIMYEISTNRVDSDKATKSWYIRWKKLIKHCLLWSSRRSKSREKPFRLMNSLTQFAGCS